MKPALPEAAASIKVYLLNKNSISGKPNPVLFPSEQHWHYESSQVVLVVKNLPANAGDARDMGSIPGSGRSPREGNGNPLQYSSLGIPMNRGDWWATVHGVTKSWTQLSMQHFRMGNYWNQTFCYSWNWIFLGFLEISKLCGGWCWARLWPEAPWHKQCWPNTLPCLPRSSGDLKTDSEFTWEVTESCECSFKGVLPQVLCAALTLSTKVLSAPNQHLHFIPLLLQWSDCIPEYKPGTPRVTSPAGGRVWGTVSLQQPHLPSQVAVDAAIWKHWSLLINVNSGALKQMVEIKPRILSNFLVSVLIAAHLCSK